MKKGEVMNKARKFHLQAKVRVRDSDEIIWEWRNIESADNDVELLAMIPKGKEADFRILDKFKYNDSVRQRKSMAYREKKTVFSNNLLRLLKQKTLTRTEASQLCGVSRETFWTYFNAVSLPSEKNLQKICEGLGVTREELLGKES